MRLHPSSRGSVLIVVLWACFGLVAIALLFGHSMLMTYRGADNDFAGRQADQAIEGAARYVETLLADAETPGLFPDRTSYVAEELAIGDATVWFLGRPNETNNGTTREYGLVDEAGKVNLNTANVAMLMLLPGMTEDLANAIIEWRSEGSGSSGANGGVSGAASEIKHGQFESIEELALVNGATHEILYGEDENLNGVLDPNEDDGSKNLPEDNSDGKLDPGILEYVTAFSRESNKQSDGTARINIKQPGEELSTLLTTKFGAARAQEIIQQAGPAGNMNSVLEFFVRSGMTTDEFGQVYDSLTTSADPFQNGLINVNTASEAVLACIPGIGTEKASSLFSARLSRTTTDTNIAWVAETLGQEGAVQAGPFITGRTSQVTADIAAVGRHGRGFRRTKFVIDQSSGTPRIIYRRNLSPYGWALGSDVRRDLALKKEVR